MSALRLSVLILVAIALFAIACGDGDTKPTDSPAATADSTQTPTATADGKTPGPGETPGATPEPTTPPPTPASVGTPAKAIDKVAEFLNKYKDKEITFEDCHYNPTTFVTDCGAKHGLFAIGPPLVGEDIACSIGLVEDKAEMIRCQVQEPLTSAYFDIQG